MASCQAGLPWRLPTTPSLESIPDPKTRYVGGPVKTKLHSSGLNELASLPRKAGYATIKYANFSVRVVSSVGAKALKSGPFRAFGPTDAIIGPCESADSRVLARCRRRRFWSCFYSARRGGWFAYEVAGWPGGPWSSVGGASSTCLKSVGRPF